MRKQNTYNGRFERNEIDSLNELVSGFTFWHQNGEYYAQAPRTPEKRFIAQSVFDLRMQITIAINAHRLSAS